MTAEVLVDNDVLLLEIEKDSPIAWLKLNRPDVHNCLNTKLLQAICDACSKLEKNKDIRVVIVIGSGAKTFCAGADLAERKGMTPGETLDYLSLIQRTMSTLESLPQPVIAAINGPAYGGGTELALSCDLRIMLDSASLALTEVTLGIIPGAGGTQRLPRLIGKSKAKEAILTARPIKAEEGKNLGLVHRLVQDPDKTLENGYNKALMQAAHEWASEIAKLAPLSLKYAKQAIDMGYDRDLQAGLAIETKNYLQLLNSKDRLEGLAAFAEKRKPNYKGE